MNATRKSLLSSWCGVLALACTSAFAAPQIPPAQGAPVSAAAPAAPAMPPLPEIKGVVSWSTLAKVKQVKAKDKIVPSFTKELQDLNGQEVTLQGFIMPLEPGEKQKHFLLTLSSPSCAYCLPAGPEGIVEIKSNTPIKYSVEPVFLKGKMSVLSDDPMGLFYRLSDADLTAVK